MKPRWNTGAHPGVASCLPVCLVCLSCLLFAGAQDPQLSPPSTGVDGGLAPLKRSVDPPLDESIRSIAMSTIDAGPFTCYEAGSYNTLCFNVTNRSVDAEWLEEVRVTFPNMLGPWDVACDSQDPTDSEGTVVNMDCQVPAPNEVVYADDDVDGYGEIFPGSSWGFCVEVWVPVGYDGPRIVNWGVTGDGDGGPPHETTGTLTVEPCAPLMLWPQIAVARGCNSLPAPVEVELWNNSASDVTYNLSYDVVSMNGEAVGPSTIHASGGARLPFEVEVLPERCVMPGQLVTVIVTASGDGQIDEMSIEMEALLTGGFQPRPPLIISTMDSVLLAAAHDGGLWSIGGLGASGAVQRYDLETELWTSHTGQPSPSIEYPMDGCYGLNADGDEVAVLFPDTAGPFAQACMDQNEQGCVMQRYNITLDSWDEPLVPAGYPPLGRWSQEVVSLYPLTGENICYLSGGATTDSGGQVNNLWEYRPDTNVTVFLGNFTHHPAGFDFHSSWFVPWIGGTGAVCVAGGIDAMGGLFADSQCYDRTAQVFNPPNADLGPLPQPWWGGADGWDLYEGRHRIWIADGVDGTGRLSGRSAYAEPAAGFVYGPDVGEPELYRLEGATVDGRFFVVGGAEGGFGHTDRVRMLAACPERIPAHDACAGAIEVGPGIYPGEFACAGTEGAASCSVGSDVDVWYRFVSPEHGTLHARTCGTNDIPQQDAGPDTILSVHPDCSGAQYSGACNDDWVSGSEPEACVGRDWGVLLDAAVPIDTVAGQDYLIRLARYDYDSALEYVLELQLEVPAGRIPDGTTAPPLLLTKLPTDVLLEWSPSCIADTGYAVYRGPIGAFDQHVPMTCDSPDPRSWQEPLSAQSHYYLVVPNNLYSEGSYGSETVGGAPAERPASASACFPQSIGVCP